MSAYSNYQKYICEMPNFLTKYLDLDIMQKLKGISIFCGMDYASPFMYNFAYEVSRYDHSLNVALVTWKLTHDKTQTLAALFHDVSTPVFSHVIDVMNGDSVNQESTEEKTGEIMLSSIKLFDYLKEDEINIEDVMDFKKYSIVDLPRPSLCADRVEGIISGGMSWVKEMSLDQAIEIVDSLTITLNENGQEEIAVKNEYIAKYMTYINDRLNELTHSSSDKYMMTLLADIVRKTIDEGYIIYDDLYRLTEEEYIRIIEDNVPYDYELGDMWNTFKTVKKPSIICDMKVKNRIINPFVRDKRLIR